MPILEVPADGPALATDSDVLDVIGQALQERADLVMLPVERLPDEFFDLSTRLAGEIVQKFVNYRLRLAIVGDISRHLAASDSLHDYVRETNRGNQVWFLETSDDERITAVR
jgi:hypothetical protein